MFNIIRLLELASDGYGKILGCISDSVFTHFVLKMNSGEIKRVYDYMPTIENNLYHEDWASVNPYTGCISIKERRNIGMSIHFDKFTKEGIIFLSFCFHIKDDVKEDVILNELKSYFHAISKGIYSFSSVDCYEPYCKANTFEEEFDRLLNTPYSSFEILKKYR